jgi:uncharacterized protein YjbI with pentapeptide repeats
MGGAWTMANPEHLEILKQGVEVWNAWRSNAPSISPDLLEADLTAWDLRGADLNMARLQRADLTRASLGRANLMGANLEGAKLDDANLDGAAILGAVFAWADMRKADLSRIRAYGMNLWATPPTSAALSRPIFLWARCAGAILKEADLSWAYLSRADFSGADFSGADLSSADLVEANLTGAQLSGADLSRAVLVDANLEDATMSGCRVYGISAWGLKISKDTNQQNLIITQFGEPEIAVDNIEVAQFVYLLLHNAKIRDVIDTVTSKVVLILGRFTPERKAILDALREELRLRGYVPILFDFEPSAGRDITETVTLLARMARFIIADLTEPSSIPKELEAIVPHLAVPVQPLLEGDRPYAMFTDYWKYDWVLPVCRYDGLDALLGILADKVIVPAETMTNALAEKRRRFETELVRPR